MKKSWNKSNQRLILTNLLVLSTLSITHVHAAVISDKDIAAEDNIIEEIEIINNETTQQLTKKQLPQNLPSEQLQEKEIKKAESVKYLLDNPKVFENLLTKLIASTNAKSLKELLPEYQKLPGHDSSIIEWGNAVIKAKDGRLKEAISDLRELNSKFPNVRLMRFQLSRALFYNGQYQAAKSEFEKLRSSTKNEKDLKAINTYLDSISQKDSWSFNANASYIDDDNLTNAPEIGTVLSGDNGSEITYDTPHQSGKGLNFSLAANKKWLNDNRTYTALNVGSRGKYYWDNDNFNDVTAFVGAGVGYQNGTTQVEVGPFFNKRWYAGGSTGDGTLKSYANTLGLKAVVNQWLHPKFKYNGQAKISDSRYDSTFSHNNGNDMLLSNSIVYQKNQNQLFNVGVDYSKKSTKSDSDSYGRKGVRLGWGQTWGKGFSSNLSLGYAERDYGGKNFSNIQRENQEYSTGVTLWNRAFSLWGLTPRFSYDYFKVDSNSILEEYDKHDFSVELTKSF